MKAHQLALCLALALLAGAAHARELQQAIPKTPKVEMPPIKDFLPDPKSVNMVPLNVFLARAGLPQWEELGLPPISEMMRPVGGPRNMMAKLPSRDQVAKMANDTIVQVVQELLPPELKALAGVQLPKLKLKQVLPTVKLPPLPRDLPPLADLLKALPPVDPKAQVALPGTGVKLPPAGELMKMLEKAADALNALPKPANMPSLQEVLNVVNSVSQSVNGVIANGGAAAPAGAAAGAGGAAAARPALTPSARVQLPSVQAPRAALRA